MDISLGILTQHFQTKSYPQGPQNEEIQVLSQGPAGPFLVFGHSLRADETDILGQAIG